MSSERSLHSEFDTSGFLRPRCVYLRQAIWVSFLDHPDVVVVLIIVVVGIVIVLVVTPSHLACQTILLL